MKRREFITLVGSAAVAWPLAANAQPPVKVWRIGVLSPGMSGESPPLQAFRQGLRDVGYVEGHNLVILWKFGDDSSDRLKILADEIIGSRVDVIFAINTSAALAAKNATSTIPIVDDESIRSDPIRTGREPFASWWKCHWSDHHLRGIGREAARIVARSAATVGPSGRALECR